MTDGQRQLGGLLGRCFSHDEIERLAGYALDAHTVAAQQGLDGAREEAARLLVSIQHALPTLDVPAFWPGRAEPPAPLAN
jgi:hypothetical protein